MITGCCDFTIMADDGELILILNIVMDTSNNTTSGKRGPGRPKGTTKPKLSAAERKSLALQSAKGAEAISTIIADHNQTLAPSNRTITDQHLEIVLARVAAGETVKAVSEAMGISAALVRQRCYDQPELWGQRLHEARRMAADQSFDEMIRVAQDTSIEVPRARLIIDVLDKMAKVHNRAVYGDKVQIDQRKVVINLTQDVADIC